ncbi:MAG TPA: M48 family metalloprotease [Candidatus Babeliales bacterium]|nr:M48 family metalloprotease [Candidatus Babeliales bacterium]
MTILSQSVALAAEVADNHGIYYVELEAFKKAPETKMIFDEDAHSGLSKIQRDTVTYKHLTRFQRFVRILFFMLDVVVVTPETMPLLYAYVDGICKKARIATPTIFITRQDGFFNAAAQKLFASSGAIVVGQKLIKDLSDNAIEGVVAHEIGHIKHNHINKILALVALQIVAYHALIRILDMQPPRAESFDNPYSFSMASLKYGLKLDGLMYLLSYIPSLIINKRFEKEADEFACKVNGKSQGIIEFFELLLKKDQLREEEFASIYELLQQNKPNLSMIDYYSLVARYYVARAGQSYTNLYKKIYYETFIGAHPSPQARIAAAQEYLETQQA